MMTQVNSKSAVCMNTVADREEVHELSACELGMISGGFVTGPLASQPTLRLVTGSDANTHTD